ncbi:MAG: homoserine dehydrogenase [Vulcanimicrobiaceae bacterium]
MQTTVGIGLLGCGTVGSGVAELLLRDRSRIENRCGVRYAVRGIAVRSLDKERGSGIPRDLLTNNAHRLIDDPQVDLVVECVGGLGESVELVERALERRKHVVTANKDAIATQGPRLFALAASKGVGLQYEAAACGAVPIVRALDASLAGDEVVEIAGVLNGTSNFILSAMHEDNSYEQALREAQERGYAEADPRNDVEGIDTAHKLAILIQLAFRQAVISPRIRRSGITSVTREHVKLAKQHGYAIKLVAFARKTLRGCEAQVAPVFVPVAHPLAGPAGAQNVVRVLGKSSGSLSFGGTGAGREPSAAAVVGDVVAALRAIGERHDFTARARYAGALAPAIDVTPAYNGFETLGPYPVWNDTLIGETPDVIHA